VRALTIPEETNAAMRDAFDPFSSLLRLERLLQAAQKGAHLMSQIVMLIIAGWIATIAMIGFFALSESGKLQEIRKRIALWREISAAVVARTSADNLEASDEDVA
jgi:hypothetical protein